jgi:lipopolysaccharide transport system ATP-binding protein
MAEDVVIRAEGLGKKYMIGHAAQRDRHTTLRDVLAHGASNFWRKTAGMALGRGILADDTVEEFWALKDISFEVKRGEALGIIGRNGAGKSTLLKILSRITEPTEGQVTIAGRVASLLEVGTGFHPELTGRENVYLNGAILGMTRAEIRRKFDEIVAFAEVEKFLDTPVKRYSSGMYVRLAFAVAAHLEPEILIVDEVLAVGDVEFQKKCLSKMDEVSRREGRTVLFVSHNMVATTTLTTRCILLDQGDIAEYGATENVVHLYLTNGLRSKVDFGKSSDVGPFRRRRIIDPPAKIVAIRIAGANEDRDTEPQIHVGAKFTLEIHLAVYRPMQAADVGVRVTAEGGEAVTSFWYSDSTSGLSIWPGDQILSVKFNDLSLAPGRYFVTIGIDPAIGSLSCDIIDNYPLMSVVNTGQITRYQEMRLGVVHCNLVEWEIAKSTTR